MNKAESSEIADNLDSRGVEKTDHILEADIVILNTCVVRQHAENKVKSMLGYMKRIQKEKPAQRVVITGCFVEHDIKSLEKKYPLVDLFFAPGDLKSFVSWLDSQILLNHSALTSPTIKNRSPISAYIPIMQGCNNYCSYCIVPYRRGRERSRTPNEILQQAKESVNKGAKEIILLGQNVNSYGKGLLEQADLTTLLAELNTIEGLHRIRFLTNHPKDMNRRLIDAIASLAKVCHHICLPLQSGDDLILERMNRNYSYDQYKSIVDELRVKVPAMSFSTDIIVGFPGETEIQFSNTYNAIREIRYDAVHVAAYSPREQTAASKNYEDDVLYEIKQQRLHQIEQLQKAMLTEINNSLLNSTVEILVEGKKGIKWYGRTYNDKLVFIESGEDLFGELVRVKISTVTPWSLQGSIVS